ncbi:MAG: FGGY-family carbohydrate kinase [Pasteurella sp.]|nr:FGGY-family carbohydrate kinase [Pasteurella sp.]
MNAEIITAGKATLGIELGSTRIKAVLIDEQYRPIATGSFDWENCLIDGIWTYSITDIWTGIQSAYKDLDEQIVNNYGVHIEILKSIGISAMMHGYMVFDKNNELLVPFRTWRNTITPQAADALTELFHYNIPQRWSIAHLYQAMLNKEPHIANIDYLTTLSGYIHWMLTGEKKLGIGDASGMFPIDTKKSDYYENMVAKFNVLVSEQSLSWKLEDILPKVVLAGKNAGSLTNKGAKLLDVGGHLKAGIPMCPPEGDAGTGMVATNSVAPRTGNISAGTSIFAMIVLEKELQRVYPEIDMVTTPSGDLVAMAHANNCTSDLNAWIGLFREFCSLKGEKIDDSLLFDILFKSALESDADCDGLLSFCFLSGENILPFNEGRPVFTRLPSSKFTLGNFIRTHLFSTLATTKIGLDILFDEEKVQLDKITGHGGIFKTKGVAQTLMAGALNTPVCVMENASEGGAWGISILSAYMSDRKENETLTSFLSERVFVHSQQSTIQPQLSDVAGFKIFLERFKAGLAIEESAITNLIK